MNILDIQPVTRVVEVIDPRTQTPLGIKVHLKSLEDKDLETVRRSIQDKALVDSHRNKAPKAKEGEANLTKIIVASIVDWEWYLPEGREKDETPNLDGETNPPASNRNITMLCEKAAWFKDQISEELSDTEAFFQTSDKG